VLAWGLLAAARAIGRRGSGAERRVAAWTAARGWLLAPAIAVSTFVVINPHLYPDPLLHTAHLFSHRVAEMRFQQEDNPEAAVPDRFDRPRLVLERSLLRYTFGGSAGLPLEAALAVPGAAALAVRTWRGWQSASPDYALGLVLLTSLAYFAGVSVFLGLDWDRYYIPRVTIGALLSGLGAATIINLGSGAGRRSYLGSPPENASGVRAP
jgi:hypothetical protein